MTKSIYKIMQGIGKSPRFNYIPQGDRYFWRFRTAPSINLT